MTLERVSDKTKRKDGGKITLHINGVLPKRKNILYCS